MMKNYYATQLRLFSIMKISLTQLLLVVLFSGFTGKTHTAVSDIKSVIVDNNMAFIITGTVLDENNEPLVGASVVLEGTTKGTLTDENGKYTLELDSKDKTGVLIISFVGYEKQTLPILERTVIDVVLVEGKALNEVVVVGYGTQKKLEVTGAVAQYKNERIDEAPVSRLDQALQGKLAGVNIQNTSSEAGTDATIRIRGLSSINAGASPLVVVDGHPVPDGLAFVNPADVASVEVLKDAASAAIYGSRGASGVILITTKSGKSEKPKYSLKLSSGIKSAYKLYDVLTTSEYTKLLFSEATLRAADPSVTTATALQITTAERAAYIVENDIMGGVATDWQQQAIRDANVKNLQFSVSGGSKSLKYFISSGYQNDQGMMYHSEYEKFNIRGKIEVQLSKRVKLNLNINPSFNKRERPSVNYIDFIRFPTYLPVYLTDATAALVAQNPLYPDVKAGDFNQARFFNGRVYSGTMPDGSIWTNTTAITPFATANNTPKSVMETRTITSNDYRVLSSADLNINIASGLDFKTTASTYVNLTTGLDFAKRSSNRAGDVNKGVYNNRLFIDLLNENTLTYNKLIKDHSISLLVGATVQKTNIKNEQTTGLDYPSDNITTLNTALTIDQANTFNNTNQIGLLSYLGRVNYGYKSKYLLSASYRADGSSYFAPGNKWGYFPSVSVGWVASEEKILRGVKWLNNLKFRGSYGATGNNRIVDFAFVDLLYNANYPGGTGTGTTTIGQVPSSAILSNPNITWERTFSYNGGVDISLFKNAISIAFDMYQSKTDQLLLQQATLGFTGVPLTWNNIGSIQNDGVELELTTNNLKRKNFTWSTSANISQVKNKVIELGAEAQLLNQGERTELYLNKVGGSLIQYYGYKTDGVWLSQAQIDESKTKLTSNLSNVFVPGGLKLVDINNDGKLDANDRTVIGSPYPDFTWGVTNTFKIFDFDLSFSFQGVQGGSLVNGDPNYNETKRYAPAYNTNRWVSPANPGDGKTPYSTSGFNWMLTDYVIEDASYTSLREVLVGYTLPTNWTKKVKLGSLRFYFTAQNLFFQSGSNYRGINPEARFQTGPYATPLVDGYQRGAFPINKNYLFGIDLNF
jgi:TonB-dependent starch-binding outer membrane protein SusC